MDPESAHEAIAAIVTRLEKIPASNLLLEKTFEHQSRNLNQTIAGIEFKNPVGMAAGFDKYADLYPFLAHAGFGFVESGTFTAVPQPGNPKPRLFRFPEQEALINRMGFNNPGAEKAAAKIQSQTRPVPRGINIGKSKIAELDRAQEDYASSIKLLAPLADYLAINISSPNTPGLRELQTGSRLVELISRIKSEAATAAPGLPIFVKIAPDLDDAQLDEILSVLIGQGIPGIILTNTTLNKSSVPGGDRLEGGLSGRPLRDISTQMIKKVYKRSSKKLVIIGAGGIHTGEDALEKILAGANLIQIYTGYIYAGPFLPARINEFLDVFCKKENCSLGDIVGAQKA